MGVLKLLAASELHQFHREVGGKTMSLKRLQDNGLTVPEFRAIPAGSIQVLIDEQGQWNESLAKELAEKISHEFPKSLYAIRSSALIEDTSTQSYAGQFQTEIHVSPEGLCEAIKKVVQQAHGLLQKDLSKFSLIIQEYIVADYSGITFTRNPLGGREMVIEYHKGIGEEIVSGAIKPERYCLYWNQKPGKTLPEIDTAISSFKKIEQICKFPQDIEWCIQGTAWYFLQARPVTTLEKNDYEQSLYLDHYLKNRTEFFLEKTEISEIAPRPTPLTLDILHRIYSEGGPIQNVYRKYGIKYTSNDFLEIVGNELFVNREREIATLLPAYSYLSGADYKPTFAHFRGAWRTLINMFQIQRIPIQDPQKLLEKLIDALKHYVPAIDTFMKDYELIFEINLLAQKALSKLQFVMQKEFLSPAAVLTLRLDGEQPFTLPDGIIDVTSLQGNALEISDTTEFVAINSAAPAALDALEWYESIPSWKKSYLTPIIQMAKRYSTLREYGRWLTVAHISGIRKNTSSSSLQEWNEKDEYLKFNAYNIPARLTDRYITEAREWQGVSAGVATGILVDRDDLRKITDTKGAKSENLILYTKMLSPDLTEHFGSIKGILSEDGGLLSHLAIMAREHGIPVIVNVDLSREDFKLGDSVEMNGSTGEIQKAEGEAA